MTYLALLCAFCFGYLVNDFCRDRWDAGRKP